MKKTLGVPAVIGGDNLPSPIGIGLTDLPNIGGPSDPPGPSVPASLTVFRKVEIQNAKNFKEILKNSDAICKNLDRESWKKQHFWSEFCRWHSGRCKFKKPIKGHSREPKEKKRQETRYLSIEKGTFLLKKGHFTITLIWSLAHGFTKGRKDHSFCRNVKALPVLQEIEGSSLHKATFWNEFVCRGHLYIT